MAGTTVAPMRLIVASTASIFACNAAGGGLKKTAFSARCTTPRAGDGARSAAERGARCAVTPRGASLAMPFQKATSAPLLVSDSSRFGIAPNA